MDNESEPDISLRTAVNQQSNNTEAIINVKVTEKIGELREELQDVNQLMKSQVKQYDANRIASDSEDEAKIMRADNRAVHKKKVKAKQDRGTGSKYKSVDSIEKINWRFSLHEANVKPFKSDVSWQTIVYSDASNARYGGFIVENPYNIAHGPWIESEVSTSSTWKELTAIVESLWGLPEVDWFASDYNFKLIGFYSRFWNVYSSGVDAFSVDWRGINGLFVPPVSLIQRLLMYMLSASYWPMLCPDVDGFISEVTRFINLPPYKNVYTAGKSKKAIFGNFDLTFRMLALRRDFSSS
ncbi:unnamed protein product [Mytilus coruscus]|uniref:Uncharacterized protein n=1 Tax=Mytilus coruscus TaxID=42192 RepID=A0A6J8BZJ5_MYTCO|nr:unnamed protein product [Mytilus coruscus]